VRKILREVVPELEQYRLLARLKPEGAERMSEDQAIYEALPGLYHYSATRLSYPVFREPALPEEEEPNAD
jgi:hypothetical protein